MPQQTWRACIVFGSNVIHASWMGILFCGQGEAIEGEWIPVAGTDAIQCLDCQAKLAAFLFRRPLARGTE